MDFNTFQQRALETRLPTATAEYIRGGLVAEVGEYLGHFSKMQRDGHGWRFEEYSNNQRLRRKEIGDILWFVAALAEDEGLSLDLVAEERRVLLIKEKYLALVHSPLLYLLLTIPIHSMPDMQYDSSQDCRILSLLFRILQRMYLEPALPDRNSQSFV